jgi:beta-glucanase (GH16 family)
MRTHVWAKRVLGTGAVVVVTLWGRQAAAQTWNLVWADEFNGTGAANTAVWNYDIGGGGWGNGELEYYTGPSSVPPGGLNGVQGGGSFNISLRQESFGGEGFTSTRINTKGKHNFGPGDAMPVKFEARIANVPKTQGAWPAFWMLGADIDTVPWPGCGEIDIMETVNRDNTNYTTIHWDSGGGAASWGPTGFANVDFAAYHTYGITWTPTRIDWWLDGATNGFADITINSTEEFHGPFFALINVAVGGSWPGNPDSTTVLPLTMNVDWVHYSTASGGGPTPTPPPGATPTTPPGATPTTAPSGGNLALGRPAVASSAENAGTGAAGAVDGNTGTRWSSAFSDPQWIYVDLGSPQQINRIVLNWEAAYATAYQLQSSNDAIGWSTFYSTTTSTGGIQSINVTANGRYIRMLGTARATQFGYSLWEFEIYGAGGAAPTPTSGPTATATARTAATATATATATSSTATLLSQGHPVVGSSVENAGTAATNAVDGNTGTRWSSAFSDPQWIYVDLGATASISRVVLNWETAFGRAYQIQTSTNATTWTTIFSTTTGAGGVETLNISGSGRYVRMYGTTRATQYGYSLWEFQVYGSGGSSTPTPTSAPRSTATPTATPSGSSSFWGDTTTIPAAHNVMTFKFLNRTNGKYPDSQVFWSFNGTVHSIAEQSTFDMPANSAGRMYFGLGVAPNAANPNSYWDFIEFTIGPAVFNGNTTRVDAFGLKLAMRMHCADGFDVQVGENQATFAEDRSVTFQRFQSSVPAEFQGCATAQAPFRIPEPGGGCGFNAGGAHATYYDSYINTMWANNGITIPKPGPNGSGLGSFPDLSAAIFRHVGAAAGNFNSAGQRTNANLWSNPATFYTAAPAHYYAKFMHDVAINGLAYGFPYDDVGGYSSFITHGNPQWLEVAIGW